MDEPLVLVLCASAGLLAAATVLLLIPRSAVPVIPPHRFPLVPGMRTRPVGSGTRGRLGADGASHSPGNHGAGGTRLAPAGSAAVDAAMLLDLTAALLRAGVGIEAAVDRLARTVPGAGPLAAVHRAITAGASWELAWSGQSAQLAELGVQLSFAHATGAPTAELLHVSARQLRTRRRHESQRRAEELGVKMVLPLGICFLPAFILLGVIPVIIGLLPQIVSL